MLPFFCGSHSPQLLEHLDRHDQGGLGLDIRLGIEPVPAYAGDDPVLLHKIDAVLRPVRDLAVVADELWITAVINAPSITPKSLFFVSASNRDFILLPAAFSKPCAMICIP